MHIDYAILNFCTNIVAIMHTPNWSDLQFILSVAESGSLAKASRKLGVHHATVLRRVKVFEESMGVQIFDRSGFGYRLTPESTHILPKLQEINNHVEGLTRTIATQTEALSGPLRLTTTDSLCHAFVQDIVWSFCEKYPAIQIELLSRNDHLDFSRLEADLTIRPTLALPSELRGQKICNMGIRIYAHRHYVEKIASLHPSQWHWMAVSAHLSSVTPLL